jgi:putative flippase GtrA
MNAAVARPEPALPDAPSSARPAIEVVIPVHNEQADLAASVERLHHHLTTTFPYPFRITVADNASTDATWTIARGLADRLAGVDALHLDAKGRGRALRAAWERSDADVVAYMDVDLSTDLGALLPLVAPLLTGHSDVAIGTRLGRGSRVVRGSRREVISRAYNLLLHATLRARFTDAQCGFKAMRTVCARELLPLVEDTGWFFDTELLVIAERAGLRIHEVPVDWVDDPNSSVDVVRTAAADLRGIVRLGRALASGALPITDLRRQLGRGPLGPDLPGVPPSLLRQGVRFAGVGAASTVAYVVLFSLLRPIAGPQAANLVALLVTAIANTAANRRLTFGLRGSHGRVRSQLEGLVVFAIGLAVTSGSLAALASVAPGAGRRTEIAVLVAANLVATVLRFLLFRSVVFHPARHR